MNKSIANPLKAVDLTSHMINTIPHNFHLQRKKNEN